EPVVLCARRDAPGDVLDLLVVRDRRAAVLLDDQRHRVRNLSRLRGWPGVRGLTKTHLLAQEVEPAQRDGRQELARVEDERVADGRGLRDAEEADGERRGGVEDADV